MFVIFENKVVPLVVTVPSFVNLVIISLDPLNSALALFVKYPISTAFVEIILLLFTKVVTVSVPPNVIVPELFIVEIVVVPVVLTIDLSLLLFNVVIVSLPYRFNVPVLLTV